jgi:thymidine kinase
VRNGLFELVTGPMFAGKTELLLKRLAAAEADGKRALAVKPLIDTRWPDEIVSHSGARRRATSVRDGGELLALTEKYEVVGIDEGQFFEGDLVDAVTELQSAKRVVVAALDRNFRGEPFAVVLDLLGRADVVRQLQAICGGCRGGATLTQRYVGTIPAPFTDAVVRVGGDELYAPRCPRCYYAERELASVQTA